MQQKDNNGGFACTFETNDAQNFDCSPADFRWIPKDEQQQHNWLMRAKNTQSYLCCRGELYDQCFQHITSCSFLYHGIGGMESLNPFES